MAKISINILPKLKEWFVEKTTYDAKVSELNNNIDSKVDKTSIKTTIDSSLTNNDVVGGQAIYDKISSVENSIPDGMEHTDITDWDTATADFETKTNAASTYVAQSNISTSLSNTSSNTQVASAKAVYDLYDSIPKWKVEAVESVEALPQTGVLGTIYLVSNNGEGENHFDEYFWNNDETEPGYEKFGGLEVDVSSFVNMTQVVDYLGSNSTLTLSDEGELALNITEPTE